MYKLLTVSFLCITSLMATEIVKEEVQQQSMRWIPQTPIKEDQPKLKAFWQRKADKHPDMYKFEDNKLWFKEIVQDNL